MSLGDFLGSVIGDLFVSTSRRGLADHVNRREAGDPHPTSVHYGRFLLAINAIGCVVFCVAFGILVFHSVRLGEPVYSIWLLLLSGGVAAWTLFALWDGMARRIEWDMTGVRFRKWNGERIVSWNDIIGVEDKSHPPHVRIVFRDGKSFAISELMSGSRYFLDLVERRLSPEPDGSKRTRRRKRGKRSVH